MNKPIVLLFLVLLFSCNVNSPKQKDAIPIRNGEKEEIVKLPGTDTADENDRTVKKPANHGMVFFEAGTFLMGNDNGLPQEAPAHKVDIEPFFIDKSPVTVAQFGDFIAATNFETEAEKFGDSGVFDLNSQNWQLLPGAYWAYPFGPAGPQAENDHPVTHVSWNDAVAYCNWAGKRLPTEAEWEYAARSGKNSGNKFSWGNQVTLNGKYAANTWQGTLQSPETSDGFLFTSPVGVFGENDAGLTDMGGNVWQWCADVYKAYPGSNAQINPDKNVRVTRSGSFFFDEYGEDSFSVYFRSKNSVETSLFNTGFRCAKDGE